MSVTAKVGIDVQMDSQGGETIVAQLRSMEAELVQLAATSEGIQKGWAESMLRAVRTSRDMLGNMRALSNISLTALFDDASVKMLEDSIEAAVRNGVMQGLQAGIAAAPQLAQAARQQVARVRVTPVAPAGSDGSAVALLTRSIQDLEATMRTYTVSVGAQGIKSGSAIKQRSEALTGRPQFNVMQELNEVALRVQGRELNTQSEGLVKMIGGLGRDMARTKSDLLQFGVQLRERLDFSRLDREFVLPDELGQGGFAHVARTAFGALEGRFNLQLFSSMDLFLGELERQFNEARARGAQGMSSLQDAQGRWLTESIEGQRFLASLAQQLSLNARGGTGNVPASVVNLRGQLEASPSAVNLGAMAEGLGDSADEQEYKAVLNILTQMFQRFESIKDAREVMADLNNRENGQLAQQLQTLETMRAVNRDEVALAKELNAVSTRYNSVISQNRGLLVGASDSLNAAISTGNFKELLSLQRQYETQAQKNLNLVKELQVVMERASNLETGYLGQIRERATQTATQFAQVMPRLREFIALTQAADGRSQRSGGSATFAPFIAQLQEAASDPALSGIIGPQMIERLFSQNNRSQFLPPSMVAQFQSELVTKLNEAIQDPATSSQVIQAISTLMSRIGALAGAGSAREDLLSGAGVAVAQGISAIAPQAEQAAASLEELFFNLIRVKEAREEAGVRQNDVRGISTQTSAVLADIRSKTRVTEEPARITEKTLRDAERFRVAFLEIQDTIAEVQGWDGLILDPSQVEIAKSLDTRLAGLVRQGDQLVKRLEIARRREIGGIDTEEANARAGGSSIFSEVARGAESEEQRLRLIAKAADEARKAKNKYYDDTIKGVVESQRVERRGLDGSVVVSSADVKVVDGMVDLLGRLKQQNTDVSRSASAANIKISEGYNDIENQVEQARQKIDLLELGFQRMSKTKVAPEDLEILSLQSKNAVQEAQQLFQSLNKIRNEAKAGLNLAQSMGAGAEETAQLQMQLDRADAALASFMARAQKLSDMRFSPEFQQQQTNAGFADRGRQAAFNTQTFDSGAMRQQLAEINQDLSSMDTTRLAMASNEFKSLRTELQAAYNAALKGVRSFDALEVSMGELTQEQQVYRNELRRTLVESERLIATTNHMAGSVKTADLVVNATSTTFRDYAFQLVEGIKQQLDFAIGAGAMTAVLGSVGIAFREVISEARNMTRAFTVLQSDTKSFEEITVAATEAVRSAAVRFGLPLAAAADVVKELGSAGLSTEETLSALIPTLKTINSTNAETTQITRAVAGIYNVFKKNMADAGAQGMEFETINNTLVAVFRNHQAEMDEMVQGYKFVIGTGRAAGFTFQEMGTYLAVLNDNMIKSGMAGRGLQTIFAQLSSKGEMLKKMFGVEIDPNMPLAEQFMSILEQMNKKLATGAISAGELNKVFQIFDREGARGFVTLAQKFPEVQKALRRIKDESAGVNDELSSLVTKSLDRKFNQMRQAILDLIRQGFDKLAPYAIQFLEFVKGSAMAITQMNNATGGIIGKLAIFSFGVITLANTLRVLAAVVYGLGALQSRVLIQQTVGAIGAYAKFVIAIKTKTVAQQQEAYATAQAAAAQGALNTSVTAGLPSLAALGVVSVTNTVGFRAMGAAIWTNVKALYALMAPMLAIVAAGAVFYAFSTGAAEAASFVENLQGRIDDLNASLSKTSAKQSAMKGVGEAFDQFDKIANLGKTDPENFGAALRQQITKLGDEALTVSGVTLMSNKEIGESYRLLAQQVRGYAKEREKALKIEQDEQRVAIVKGLALDLDLQFGGGKSIDDAITEAIMSHEDTFIGSLQTLAAASMSSDMWAGIRVPMRALQGLPDGLKDSIEKDIANIVDPSSMKGLFKKLDDELAVQTKKLADAQRQNQYDVVAGDTRGQMVNEKNMAEAVAAINDINKRREQMSAGIRSGDFSLIDDKSFKDQIITSTKRTEEFVSSVIKARSRLRTAFAVKPTDLEGLKKIDEKVFEMTRLTGKNLDWLKGRLDEFKVSIADIQEVGAQDAFAATFRSIDDLREQFGVPLDPKMFNSVMSNLRDINTRVAVSKQNFAEFRRLGLQSLNQRKTGELSGRDFSERGFQPAAMPGGLKVDKAGTRRLIEDAVMIDKDLQKRFIESLGGADMEAAIESLFSAYDEKSGMATLSSEQFVKAVEVMSLSMMDASTSADQFTEAFDKTISSIMAITQNKILEDTAREFERFFMDIEQGAIRAVESNALMSKIYKRNEFAQQFDTTREKVREAIAAVEDLNAAQNGGAATSGGIGLSDQKRLAMAQSILKMERDKLVLQEKGFAEQAAQSSLSEEAQQQREEGNKQLDKQGQQFDFINQLAKVLFESQANRIRQNREIAAQIEKEKNAFNDAAFAAKQINTFQTDGLAILSSTAKRSRLIVEQKLREMKLDRELLGNGKESVAAYTQIINLQQTYLKDRIKLLDTYAEENEMLMETYGIAASMLAPKGFREVTLDILTLASKLPAINRIRQQINEVNKAYASGATTAFQMQSETIRLLNKEVKLLKDRADMLDKIKKKMAEAMFDDRRPEIGKDFIKAIQTVRAPLEAFIKSAMGTDIARAPLKASLTLSKALGVSFGQVVGQTNEFADTLLDALRAGKVNIDALPEPIARAAREAKKLYDLEAERERVLLKLTQQRMDLNATRFNESIREGDYEGANKALADFDKDFVEMASRTNAAGLAALDTLRMQMDEQVRGLEKAAKNEMLISVGFRNMDVFKRDAALIRDELRSIMSILGPMMGDGNMDLAAALKGEGSFRLPQIEKDFEVNLDFLSNEITRLQNIVDSFAALQSQTTKSGRAAAKKNLAANLKTETGGYRSNPDVSDLRNSGVAAAAGAGASLGTFIGRAAELYEEQAVTMSSALKVAADYTLGKAEDAAKLAGDQAAARMLTRVIGVGIENTMERATSKAVADAAIGAQQSQADREREAKLMEITYKNTPLAVREAFLKGVDEMMNTAMAEGSWKGLAAALVKRIPSMFASITTGLTPALEAIGNIEYAVSNAQSFEQLIEDIKTASQEFASSVQTANDGLARNENSYYDYINSIQDAERTRYEALMAAEKTYQDALMRTGQVFKDNFLGPAVENIGAGFSNALAGLQELEVFTAPLGALNTKNNLGTLFDGLTGGAQVGGSDMLDAGLGLVGAGGLSLATTTISAIGTVFGMVFNSALTGQSEYLIDFIKKFASELPNTIKTVMKEVGPLFKEIFLILVDDVLPNVLTALVEVLPGLLSEVIVTVVQKFPEIISMMLGALFQLIRPLIGVVFEMAGALLPNLANLIAELTAVIPTLAVLMIVGLVENLPMLIARLIPAIIGAVIGIVPDLILRTIGGISKGLTGTDITKGFSVTKTITNALGGALGLDKFHEGGLVPGRGERPAMLLGGEAVLTREAVAMLGGVKAINNINGGQFIPDYQRVATSSTPMSAPSRVSAAPQTYNTNNQKTQTFHLTVNAASGTSRDETLRNSRLMVAELRKKMKQADKNRE